MPEATFTEHGDASGHWHSRETVSPLSVEPVGDLLSALAEANAELRITPRLYEMWMAVIESTLEFSGTRLRNARGWFDASG